MSKSALRLWKFDAGSSTSSVGSLTFWCLPEPLSPPPPSLLEILVPCSYCIYLLIPQPAPLLASLTPYFPIFSVYKNILVISILHPVRTICLYRKYSIGGIRRATRKPRCIQEVGKLICQPRAVQREIVMHMGLVTFCISPARSH